MIKIKISCLSNQFSKYKLECVKHPNFFPPHLILHGVFYFAIFKLRLFVFFTLGAAILKPKNDQFNEQK